MKIKILGTRGSLPTPSNKGFETCEYGGNSTCIAVKSDYEDKYHIIDAGSGINQLNSTIGKAPINANLYFTHTHQDHIIGFPFFTPIYRPENNIEIFGLARYFAISPATGEEHYLGDYVGPEGYGKIAIERGIRESLEKAFGPEHFPVQIENMKGIKKFNNILPRGNTVYESDFMKVETLGVNHPGGCISYKFSEKNPNGEIKSFIFSTDFEPGIDKYDQEIKDFWNGSSLIIADGQYEKMDKNAPNRFMEGWGHSTYIDNIIFAMGNRRLEKLILTHHDPKSSDIYLREMEKKAKQFAYNAKMNSEIGMAKEGITYRI